MQSPKVRLALALVMIFNIYNEKYNISLLSVKVSSSVHQNAFFFSTLLSEKMKKKRNLLSQMTTEQIVQRAIKKFAQNNNAVGCSECKKHGGHGW